MRSSSRLDSSSSLCLSLSTYHIFDGNTCKFKHNFMFESNFKLKLDLS